MQPGFSPKELLGEVRVPSQTPKRQRVLEFEFVQKTVFRPRVLKENLPGFLQQMENRRLLVYPEPLDRLSLDLEPLLLADLGVVLPPLLEGEEVDLFFCVQHDANRASGDR